MSGWQIFGVLCAVAVPLIMCFVALIGRLNTPGSAKFDEPHFRED